MLLKILFVDFENLITMCLHTGLIDFTKLEIFRDSSMWMLISPSKLGKVFAIVYLN
jgi:hypothetical protein